MGQHKNKHRHSTQSSDNTFSIIIICAIGKECLRICKLSDNNVILYQLNCESLSGKGLHPVIASRGF